MNTKLSYANFELQKVKLTSKKGLIIDWFDLEKKNDLFNVESDSEPHEDLIEKLNELKEVFAITLGLKNGWDTARENNRKNEEELKKSVGGWYNEIERCNVSGISITSTGIKITGSLDGDFGVIALASPLIKFEEEIENLGNRVGEILEEISKEVWAYIYKGKRGNDLFNQKQDESGLGSSTMKKVV